METWTHHGAQITTATGKPVALAHSPDLDPMTTPDAGPNQQIAKIECGKLRPMENKPAIKELYHDSDGWWVILKDGWTIDDCVGCREDTKKALMARIKDAKRTGLE